MSKTVLFFPGQASQYVGMGKDLYDAFDEVKKLYELASDQLGADIAKLSFEGPAEELKRTRFTQPAILLHSLAVLVYLKDNLPQFDFAAGHSLGEYVAHAVTGSFSFEDSVKVVVRRATLMEEACRKNPGTMAAVMGLTEEKVNQVCEEASAKGVVVPANFNSKIQIVISGDVEAVKEAVSIAKEAGAKRAMLIEVGGAFHSPLMEPAAAGLKEYLENIEINDITTPVVANVTAEPVTKSETIRDLLIQQLMAPVKWAHTMNFLKANDVDRVIEIGPGKVLSGLAKRDIKPSEMINLDKLADVEQFMGVTV